MICRSQKRRMNKGWDRLGWAQLDACFAPNSGSALYCFLKNGIKSTNNGRLCANRLGLSDFPAALAPPSVIVTGITDQAYDDSGSHMDQFLCTEAKQIHEDYSRFRYH